MPHGVDFLSAPLGGKTGYRLGVRPPGTIAGFGTGPMQRMRLIGGRAGHTIVVGATSAGSPGPDCA